MPIFYQSSSSNMLTFKVILISSTVLSAAIMLTLTDFAGSVPSFYNALVSWLRPPYLYLLLNCIIITIVASSKLHPTKDDAAPPQPVEYKYDGVVLKDSSRYQVNNVETTTGNEELPAVFDESNKENEYVVAKSALQSDDFRECSPSNVKPPVSARFGHRKNAKASPEGSSGGRTVLGVSKAKKQETLESTWKTITEGRPIPISRHLRKSDTWGERERDQPQKTMQKSETFNNRSSISSRKLRKEASLSQDELNRRVEAFIKKFNEDMRLQRQDSLNHYKEMVSRR